MPTGAREWRTVLLRMPIFHQLAAGAPIFRCALEWNRIVDGLSLASPDASIEVHCNTGLFLRRTQAPRARRFRRRMAHSLHARVDVEVSGHGLPAVREEQLEHPRLRCTPISFDCSPLPFALTLDGSCTNAQAPTVAFAQQQSRTRATARTQGEGCAPLGCVVCRDQADGRCVFATLRTLCSRAIHSRLLFCRLCSQDGCRSFRRCRTFRCSASCAHCAKANLH